MKNLQILITVMVVGVMLIVWNLGRGNNTDDRQYIFEPQTNSEGEVSITVSLINITGGGSWEFAILLDTHSEELDVDLTQAVILKDENGREYKPLHWEGDPPGGHHREGILKFNPITPTPKTLKLVIRQIGGIAEREFLWTPLEAGRP